jgi:hypothetical protein
MPAAHAIAPAGANPSNHVPTPEFFAEIGED